MSGKANKFGFLVEVRKQMQAEEETQPAPDPNHTLTEPAPSPEPHQTPSVPAPKGHRTRTGVAPNQPRFKSGAVAPERDYNKRANSIEREALPAGAFPGSSKKIYDALYLRTRGAIQPARTIQARRRELLAWSGLRDIKTIDQHLKKLQDAGLVARTKLAGEHEGSIYEIFLPEEVDPHRTRTVAVPEPNRETEIHRTQETVRVGLGQTVDFQRASDEPKTSFKTNTEKLDDEAAPLARALTRAERELTGKVTADPSKWEDLADLLITELRIAAGRTTVSSVPAFLAEHLRRRLWKQEKGAPALKNDSSPPSAQERAISKDCPDCLGVGMWYPEGFDKGVARCRHERLK